MGSPLCIKRQIPQNIAMVISTNSVSNPHGKQVKLRDNSFNVLFLTYYSTFQPYRESIRQVLRLLQFDTQIVLLYPQAIRDRITTAKTISLSVNSTFAVYHKTLLIIRQSVYESSSSIF